ncbi:menaquinone biosynthesis decarboxylase [Vulcanimicrobium alpinum]|uniref:Menaquinone biosynthesis decarboxylase n=1 Tax=Vulcanimicrobium alpinum TaxID=3016050 RepID=A0AAN1XTA1_UNVUL|nr:menaquinone biosynthesis decarboxylase [Vulcanimicrobium alpinum]BDE04839.1 menaquinone biosynthesis decarboxylase [Vulcanimicrobium alpinum]
MAYDSLAAFARALRAAGELATIDAEVDPRLEISEITDRVVKAGGPALLFSHVRGSRFPVLTNQFGSERRAAMAFGARTLREVEERLRRTIDLAVPPTLGAKVTRLADLAFAGRAAMPVRVKGAAPSQAVVIDPPDLRQLPVLTTWPLDGGPFVTLPLVFTRDPQTRRPNVGMYRVQIYDGTTAGMHWQRHKQGRAHAEKWGRRIPVAVVIGDPVLTYAATAPLPPIIDELAFAGFLRGKPMRMTNAVSVDLDVPADAEFVIEGYVDNDDLRVEGPFGDHTGVYSAADLYPTLHVTAITHRADAIWGATVVGKPPMEDAWLGKATERIFLPLLQMVVPEIVDYNLPVEGGFHNLVIVAVRKSYPGQAKKVMNALWGLGHMMMLTRCIVVVDHDVDVHDVRGVVWNALNNVDPARDFVVMPGPVDDLDHAGSYELALGNKLGIDATRKRADEGYARDWPPEIRSDAETRELVNARWTEYGIGDLMRIGRADAWSGQGPARFARLLAEPPRAPGEVAPRTDRVK